MSIIPTSLKSAVFSLFLLSAIVTLLALWLISPPSAQSSTQTEKDDWQLLVSEKESDIDFFNKLRAQHLWKLEEEIVIDGDAEKNNVPKDDWQLFGIVNEGKLRYALLQDKGEKINRYEMGDILEEGIELINIYDDAIEIKKIEENITKNLYSKTLESNVVDVKK